MIRIGDVVTVKVPNSIYYYPYGGEIHRGKVWKINKKSYNVEFTAHGEYFNINIPKNKNDEITEKID